MKIVSCFLLLCQQVLALDPCIQEVKMHYKKLVAISQAPMDKKVYYMRYTVKSIPADSVVKPATSTTIQMWINKEGVVVKSKEMEVYQNAEDVFALLPSQKMVLRSQPLPPSAGRRDARLTMIQDTLFALSGVVRCEQEGSVKTIVLKPNQLGQQLLNILQITFVLNKQEQRIEKVTIDYTDQYREQKKEGLASVEYLFNDLILDYKGQRPLPKAKERFLTKDNKLTREFSGYTYLDNRKKN